MNNDDFEQQLTRQPLRPPPREWREEILAAARARTVSAPTRSAESVHRFSALQAVRSKLSSLLWPNPTAWAGLAAVWLVILIFNHAGAGQGEKVARAAAPSAAERAAVQEQKRELARLLAPSDGQLIAEPSKPARPGPRSQHTQPTGAA